MTLHTLILLTLLLANTAAQASPHPNRISAAREHVVHLLNDGLAGTPMAHTGRQLEAAGWKWHVHPAFIAGVAGIEAAWGRLACRDNRFNAFGLGSCGTAWSPPTFRSWAAAYDYMARFIHSRWPSARTPYDMHGYCVTSSGADCPDWPAKVAWNMERLGFGPSLRYGR